MGALIWHARTTSDGVIRKKKYPWGSCIHKCYSFPSKNNVANFEQRPSLLDQLPATSHPWYRDWWEVAGCDQHHEAPETMEQRFLIQARDVLDQIEVAEAPEGHLNRGSSIQL